MDDRLIVTASPHIRDNATTRGLMGNVLIALVPSIVASGLIFGMRAILLTAVTTLACVVFEYLYCKLMHKPNPVGDLSACVTGVILALNMPVSMPLWIAIVGALVAIVIIKQLFGGLGYNFANPALVGRIVLFLGFTSRMTAYVYPDMSVDALASATPLNAAVDLHSVTFVDMFVGVGASRVRDLFEEAKKNAPCIIFIDEIDAVARRRGTGMGGGHDEREQTLNQLLVEMDGFGVNEGIIVMAATNRVDILDPAILRPGRFDRKVMVGRPDIKGREEILKVHAKGKPLSEEINLQQIAQTTAGFTGADLENLLNEAAILAAKDNRVFLKQEDIKKAFVKVGIGAEKKSRVISEKEKRITAFHEAGHAILFHVLPDVGPVYSVSIIPTGSAGGYTMPLPEKDEMFNTKGKMLQDITVALGGRVAEEEVFDDITTGASQDIKQATGLAKSMVTKFGMSEAVGLINYDDDNNEVFIGRDLAHTARGYGEGVATVIDQEVKRIIDECYDRARHIIRKYDDVLHACADLLLEKEKISREEFEALFPEDVSED